MRFVRRASLVLSLVLIVSIAVGYAVRTSELARDRDASLDAAAELGAARLSSFVQASVVAARVGVDAGTTATSLAALHPDLGVCVVATDGAECAGAGPLADRSVIDRERERRVTAEIGDPTGANATVTVDDTVVSVLVPGPDLTVVATAPADLIDDPSAAFVEASTLLPAGVDVGGFADDQGRRRTAAVVSGVDEVYVTATGRAAVSLPVDEYRFYLIIFVLALVLLVLAGITLVVEHRSLVERASFDSLTRLPNRGEFERRAIDTLGLAERSDRGACLLLFDLDGFKQVNDTYGHLAGDEMLKVVGARLRRAVRNDDVVARWGGDEFVILMPGIATEEMGSRRALQLAEQVAGRTRLDGVPDALRIEVSVGVAIWPTHGEDLDALVVAADQAMYEAKRQGTTCRVAAVPDRAPLPTTVA